MKRKLELTWVGKEERPRLEPRLLVEEDRWGDEGAAPNLLIQGDNLLALKALEADHAGKVKCVFIDPPYNTGSAFEHYDDGLEHSIWLSMMRDRLEVIRNLLSEDGSLWVTLDDNEAHYFKVMADEVFGRRNFVANVVWQKAYTANQTAIHLSNTHDHVLVYARDFQNLSVSNLERTEEQVSKFTNHDNDPRGPWKAETFPPENSTLRDSSQSSDRMETASCHLRVGIGAATRLSIMLGYPTEGSPSGKEEKVGQCSRSFFARWSVE